MKLILLFFFAAMQVSLLAQVTENSKTDSLVAPKNIVSKDTIPTNKTNTKIINDSLKVRTKSASRATWCSVILPGLGQIYNEKYWKVPIIYSMFAGVVFMVGENNFKYNLYKEQYIKIVRTGKVDPDFTGYTKASLQQRKDYYKRNRDFSIILGALTYLLNILDANVDAHLMDYDVTPDLTIRVQPEVNNYFAGQNNFSNQTTFGMKFVFSLH